MKNFLSPLKLKGYLTLIGLVIIGFGWLLIDQIFLPEVYQRVIMHVIIKNDFTYKSILIWVITAILPYAAGFIYIKTKKK
jgi:hypothetical protein